MFSQCPNCLARFRVTAARMRAGRGRARCGRCGEPFDLFERLSDQLPGVPGDPPLPAAPMQAQPTLVDAEAELANVVESEHLEVGSATDVGDYHFSAEDIEKVFIDARDWHKRHGGAVEAAPAPDDAAEEGAELVVDESEGVEDITLEGVKVEIDNGTGESLRLEAEFDLDEDELDEDADDDEDVVDDENLDDEDLDDEDVEDLDSTSRLRTLENVPDSEYADDDDGERGTAPDTDEETRFYRALIEGRDLPEISKGAAGGAGGAEAHRSEIPARREVTRAAAVTPLRPESRNTPAERWSEARSAAASDDALAGLDLSPVRSPPTRGSRWFALGSAALALTLAAQVVHHFRQDIVRHPQAGPILARVYDWIGSPLSPNWNLDAFELSQWGPTEDLKPGAALTVRASLTNGADHAQPYPLLRLEFEDRYGAAVAQRDFLPGEYLKSPSQAARQLAAGEATEAELSVIAPGTDAVGYRLDTCIREAAGRVRCAHGAG